MCRDGPRSKFGALAGLRSYAGIKGPRPDIVRARQGKKPATSALVLASSMLSLLP